MSISAIVISKNAENIIERALSSVQFADEVILVDIKSEDKTLEKAKKLAGKIYKYPKDSKFVEPVRNFALEKASKDWILVLDADEEIPATLAKKLKEISENNDKDAFYIARKNLVFNKWIEHTGWWPDQQLRFFKKGSISWSDKIHAQPYYKGQAITKENRKELKNNISFLEVSEDLAILHHNYQSVADYWQRFDRYTEIEAGQTAIDDFKISNSDLFKSFKDEFFRRFFDRDGWKDQSHGLYLSLSQAIYQMTVKMRVWDRLDYEKNADKSDIKEFLKDLKDFQKELDFWIADLELKQKKGLSRIFVKIKRKIKL
jgi:(heptosyl)LPS beta-1,4-glucosyltransferase